jgi:hypothetical protein
MRPFGLDKGHREYKQDWRNLGEIDMAVKLNDKQIVSFEELLMSQVVSQEALTRVLVKKGILTKEELLNMVGVADREMTIKNRET